MPAGFPLMHYGFRHSSFVKKREFEDCGPLGNEDLHSWFFNVQSCIKDQPLKERFVYTLFAQLHILPPVIHEGGDSYGEFLCFADILPDCVPTLTVPPFDPGVDDPAVIINLIPVKIRDKALGRMRRLFKATKGGGTASKEQALLPDASLDDAVRWMWRYKWLCARSLRGEVFAGCSTESPEFLFSS